MRTTNEELQIALLDIENKFCSCRRLTTSDSFRPSDHEIECAIVQAIKDDRPLKMLADVAREVDDFRSGSPLSGALFYGIVHILEQYGFLNERAFEEPSP